MHTSIESCAGSKTQRPKEGELAVSRASIRWLSRYSLESGGTKVYEVEMQKAGTQIVLHLPVSLNFSNLSEFVGGCLQEVRLGHFHSFF